MDRHQSNVADTKIMDKNIECAKVENEEHAVMNINDRRVISLDQDNWGENFNEIIEDFNQKMVAFEQTNSNYSMEEIEEVYDKIEEEHQKINHIFEIKELLLNNENETEKEITISLQKLALIVVSLEDLMVTDIGTIVRGLQKHWSKKVIREAKRVTKKFKRIKEKRFAENADLSTRTKGQDPCKILDEPVLYNIPMDKGMPIAYTPELDLATFFEDINNDGNLMTDNCESKELHESQRKPSVENTEHSSSATINTTQKQKQEFMDKLISPTNYTTPLKNLEIGMIDECSQPTPTKKCKQSAWEETNEKWKRGYRPSDTRFSLQRYAQHRQYKDSNNDGKTKKKDDQKVHKRSSNAGPKHSQGTTTDVANMEEKLETTKKKLYEGYKAHERDRRSTRYFAGYEYDLQKDKCSGRRSCPS